MDATGRSSPRRSGEIVPTPFSGQVSLGARPGGSQTAGPGDKVPSRGPSVDNTNPGVPGLVSLIQLNQGEGSERKDRELPRCSSLKIPGAGDSKGSEPPRPLGLDGLFAGSLGIGGAVPGALGAIDNSNDRRLSPLARQGLDATGSAGGPGLRNNLRNPIDPGGVGSDPYRIGTKIEASVCKVPVLPSLSPSDSNPSATLRLGPTGDRLLPAATTSLGPVGMLIQVQDVAGGRCETKSKFKATNNSDTANSLSPGSFFAARLDDIRRGANPPAPSDTSPHSPRNNINLNQVVMGGGQIASLQADQSLGRSLPGADFNTLPRLPRVSSGQSSDLAVSLCDLTKKINNPNVLTPEGVAGTSQRAPQVGGVQQQGKDFVGTSASMVLGCSLGNTLKVATTEVATSSGTSALRGRGGDVSTPDNPPSSGRLSGNRNRNGSDIAQNLSVSHSDSASGQLGQSRKKETDTIGGFASTQVNEGFRESSRPRNPASVEPVADARRGAGAPQPSTSDRPNDPSGDLTTVTSVGGAGPQRSPDVVQSFASNQQFRSGSLSRMALDGGSAIAVGKVEAIDSALIKGLPSQVDAIRANLADALASATSTDRRASSQGTRIETGVSLSGKPLEFSIGSIKFQTPNGGNEVKISSVFVGAGKTAGTDVSPLSVQQLHIAPNSGLPIFISGDGRNSSGQKIDIVIGESVRPAGLVDSINALTGKLFPIGKSITSSDIGTAKVDVTVGVKAVSIQIGGLQGSIPGIVSGAISSTRTDLIGTAKDVSGLIPVGKADASGLLTGARSDFISGWKEQIASLLPTSLTGKLTTADSSGIKADGITVTTTAISGLNTPHGLIGNAGAKGDAAGSVKGDGVGKGDAVVTPTGKSPYSIEGIVRGVGLTPPLVASIALAIKSGQPLPEGVTLQNGEIAIKHGDEVLFFPGLKAALKFAELVGLVDSETEEALEEDDQDTADNQDSWASETRVKYAVHEGDTIETISTKQLGDKRFADLIVTINRSEILFRLVNGQKAPFVYPGQVLWLPSPRELAVHRKNYFVEKKATLLKSLSMGSGCDTDDENAAEPIVKEQEITAKEACNALNEEYRKTVVNPPRLGNPKTTVRDLPQIQTGDNELFSVLNRVRRTGDRPSLEIAVPVLDRNPRGKVVTAPVILHVAEVKEDTVSDTIIILRDEADRAPVETQRLLEVRPLSRDARVIVSDLRSHPGSISVKLEMIVDDDWTLVAAYEGTESGANRIRYGRNGDQSTMKVQLPSRIVKAMALEDFTRNWSMYQTNFIASVVKNGVDSTPHQQQTPMPTCNKVSMGKLSSGNRVIFRSLKNANL